MTSFLKRIKQLFKKYGAKLEFKKYRINILINPFKNIDSFIKLRPLIYYLLNNYQGIYFITIEGIPYCLLPDAEDHIIYTKLPNKRYIKKNSCKKCKFFSKCPGVPNTKLFRQININPIIDAPKQIVIEITKKCNQNCVFCLQKDKEAVSSSLDKIKEIIDEAKSLGIKEIRFTGGEPLLELDKLLEAMKYAKSKGFYIFLNTNAILLNDKVINKIENFVDNILISLHGVNSQIDSLITQKKLFNIKIKNILNVQKSKIFIKRAGTIMSKYLLKNLDKYYFLLKKLNIKIWEIYRPMMDKNMISRNSQFNISTKDILILSKFLYKLKRTEIKAWIGNPVPFCITKSKELMASICLGARYDDGHSRIIWDARGYFKPSYFIDINLGKTITEAWNHPFLKKIRSLEYLPTICQECEFLKWCLGGSRYLAAKYRGDFFSPDPWLDYSRK